MRLPAPVPPGGTIGVCAPAGPVLPERLAVGLRALRQAGFRLVLTPRLFARSTDLPYLAGDDADRLRDLQALLDDPRIDAVIAARGGYGVMRLLGRLDLRRLRAAPKPVVGFSDLTALHLALGRAGVVSFHGPMIEADPETGFGEPNLERLVRALTDPRPLPPLEGAAPVVPGRAQGRLVGGNLTLLAASLGTPWEPDTRGAILLVEDVDEPAYRLDRCLTQLIAAGALQRAAAVAAGEFAACPGAELVLRERLGALGLPSALGFPFGHGRERAVLPLGVAARLDAGAGRLAFAAPALRQENRPGRRS